MKIKGTSPDVFAKEQNEETRAHVVSNDLGWAAVMKLAERCGFILQAAGGTAFLATQENQIKHIVALHSMKTMTVRFVYELDGNGALVGLVPEPQEGAAK